MQLYHFARTQLLQARTFALPDFCLLPVCWLHKICARYASAPLQVCSGVEDAENMMLCDGCDRGCHAGCARLAALPATTTWHCSGCAAGKAHAGQQHAAAAAAVDLTLDDSDSDEDAPLGAVLTAAAGTPPRGGKGVAVLAAERRLERARRELRSGVQVGGDAAAVEAACGPALHGLGWQNPTISVAAEQDC